MKSDTTRPHNPILDDPCFPTASVVQETVTTKRKSKTYWAGFSNGKLDSNECLFESCQSMRVPALFRTKENARMIYQDVRKVKIIEVK